jgi:hypothetical protein
VGPALRRARWTNAFGIADPARHEFERPDFAMGGNAGIVEVVELSLLHCALGEENPNQQRKCSVSINAHHFDRFIRRISRKPNIPMVIPMPESRDDRHHLRFSG